MNRGVPELKIHTQGYSFGGIWAHGNRFFGISGIGLPKCCKALGTILQQ